MKNVSKVCYEVVDYNNKYRVIMWSLLTIWICDYTIDVDSWG